MSFPERIREMYPGVDMTYTLHTWGVNGSTYFPQATVTKMGRPSGKITMDTLNNHYRPGVLAVRPFDIRSYQATCTNFNLKYYFPKKPAGFPDGAEPCNRLTGFLAMSGLSPESISTPQAGVPSRLEPEAWSRAFAKVGRPSAGGLQNLLEAQQLAKQIQGPLRGVQECFNRLSKGYRGPRRNWPQTLRGAGQRAADRWLEYQFGWRPIFQDITGTISTFERAMNASRSGFEVAPGSASYATSTESAPYTYLQNYWWCKAIAFTDVSYTHSIKLYYSLWDDPGRYEMTKLGLNPRFWGGAAFDVIPWSFLVDWATGLQDYLYARAAVGMPGYLGASSSIKTVMTTGRRISTVWDIAGRLQSGGTGSYTTEKYYRTSAVVPTQMSVDSLLSLRNPLSSINRSFDSMALGWQQSNARSKP